jgi:hypothetical protein
MYVSAFFEYDSIRAWHRADGSSPGRCPLPTSNRSFAVSHAFVVPLKYPSLSPIVNALLSAGLHDSHSCPVASRPRGDEPTVGIAAFAGLREGEIRGLWWEDDGGDILNIRRSVWRTIVKDDTKTYEDEEDPGVVPIIQPLRLMLDCIRPTAACGFMFPNTRNGSLDLDNLADRVVKPALKAKALQEGVAGIPQGTCHKPQETRGSGHGDPSHPAA